MGTHGNETFGVVLLNLGGPPDIASIRPFLRRMFSDPAILRLPGPVRFVLAQVIAVFRAPLVAGRYRRIGGGSPILQETLKQATALQAELSAEGLPVRCAMRYSPPFAAQTLAEFRQAGVRTVIALPLFPQRSCSTTDSSLLDLETAAAEVGLNVVTVREYPQMEGFVSALAGPLQAALEAERASVVFTAHGLPEIYARNGDPYVQQVRETVAAVVARLEPPPTYFLAFQSRIGPVKWVGPDAGELIARLGGEGVRSLVVCPVSFVSEHLETLYDLDIDLPRVAAAAGIARYRRMATVRDDPRFIGGLAALVRFKLQEARHEGSRS